jgi:RNA polymerase sigma-70 factor (ECF subfamily)
MIDHSPVTDEQLMLRVATGDASALEELYDRYVRQCFGLALRLVGNAEHAEEIVQEVFLKLWSQPSSYLPERGKFVSWLLTLVHHRCIDSLRKRSRSEVRLEDPTMGSILDVEPDPDPEPAAQLATLEERRVVRDALGQIPSNQRQVLELAYFGGLTQSQIAAKLNEPLGTVKTRVRMGLQNLRALLEPHGLFSE